MKILDVHLCNFKNYCGEHILDFSTDIGLQKNIILIGGLNGAGKTTIFEAIKICLFGKNFNGKTHSKMQYERLIISFKNQISIQKNDDRYFIQIKIELDDVFPIYTIDLHREWLFIDNKIEEKFIILRDGYPLEIIAQEYWEDFIKNLIPPYVSDYFFFDGERMRELTAGDNAESILHDSIRDLIGLKLYETLINDLDSLQSKLKQKNINNEAIINQLKELEKEIDTVKIKIQEKGSHLSDETQKISEANNRIHILEEDLQRKAGTIAKNRKEIDDELIKIREDIDYLNRDIIKFCDYVPFVMASQLCNEVIEQIAQEKIFKEGSSNKLILENVNISLLKRIEENKQGRFQQEQIDILKAEINSIFSEMKNNFETDKKILLIHDLTNSKTEYFTSFLLSLELKGKTEFSNKLQERERLKIKIKKLEKNLQKSPNDSLVSNYIEDISKEKSIVEVAQKQIPLIEEERNTLLEKYNIFNEQIKTLENSSICAVEDRLKIDVCSKIKTSLDEFIKVILASKTEELGHIITQMYRKLANKEDMIKEIKIDSDTFTTILSNSKGELINKNDLSAGEKEIYALSILWGLSKLSKSKLPIIVDSFLARLDTSHVDKIVKNFFPNAGDQVIVFSHDREVDERLYKKILPHISRSYLLALEGNEKEKIKTGYFFE